MSVQNSTQNKKHLISILMENEAGSLSRVVGLFSQRGYNIDTLNVAATEDPTISRLTLTTITSDDKIEQITKQLHKLIEVVKVQNLTDPTTVNQGGHIERELMLIKVRAVGAVRDEIKRTADIFRAQIVDVAPNLYTILITGDVAKLDGFIEVIGKDKVLEVVRSGVIGIARGERTLSL
ncbi:MAG: acetolactate synthase small subunit [Moraxella sp.]|nr:acetolactate synthase small subunit [Moraxella sp.]